MGKTSIINRLVDNSFTDKRVSTTGFDVGVLKINDKKYTIWDTAGQMDYNTMTSTHYRDADLVMLVYDLTDSESMKKMEFWIRRITDLCPFDTKTVIIGNKNDIGNKVYFGKNKSTGSRCIICFG